MTERLAHTMERFMTTISQYGALSHTVDSKIDGLNTQLGNMEHRLESMKHHLDDVDNKMATLDARFNILDGYLLEVIKREQVAMEKFGDLASRYHRKDL
ncbi:uncharacterized protein PFLUO_LOCUS6449 [Penicillium psychrofluorescens]|uniref:uncharacterized protein n=1 Tax=Penicillium psychrofluorescens TaxID=3158075 RepID=UPI003CCDA716